MDIFSIEARELPKQVICSENNILRDSQEVIVLKNINIL